MVRFHHVSIDERRKFQAAEDAEDNAQVASDNMSIDGDAGAGLEEVIEESRKLQHSSK